MKKTLLLLIAGMLLFSGCSSVSTRDIKITTEADSNVNFEGYRYYDWLATATILNDPHGQWEPLDFDADAEVRFLINRQLRQRGMAESDIAPDFYITFAGGVDMAALKLKVDPETDMEVLENIPAGALLVVFIDSDTGLATWAGLATAEVQEEHNAETAKARLDYAITKMIKQLPK